MRPTALILMYHDLAPSGAPVSPERAPYVLDREKFRRQIRAIRESGYHVLTLADWVRSRSVEEVLPRRASPQALILTFDDGDASNHAHALPMLLEAGLKATFFVTVGRIGDPGYLTWDQILDLQRAGMEIGSHTLTHRPPVLLSDADLRYELVESKKRLEERIDAPVLAISSPTGFFNARMSVLARDAGYAALCGGRIGLAVTGSDLFTLPRVPIKRDLTDAGFRSILRPSRLYLARMRARQIVRNGLKRLLGPRSYLLLRRWALGLRTWR